MEPDQSLKNSTIEDEISKLIINNQGRGSNLVMMVEDNNIKVTIKNS